MYILPSDQKQLSLCSTSPEAEVQTEFDDKARRECCVVPPLIHASMQATFPTPNHRIRGTTLTRSELATHRKVHGIDHHRSFARVPSASHLLSLFVCDFPIANNLVSFLTSSIEAVHLSLSKGNSMTYGGRFQGPEMMRRRPLVQKSDRPCYASNARYISFLPRATPRTDF